MPARVVCSTRHGRVGPDQYAALRRLRAAFGFIQVLRIVDHDVGQGQDDDPIEDGDQAPPADR